MGYGISIINDNIGDGVVQETQFDAVLSYTVDVALDAKLSFGLKVGGNMLSLDFNGLNNFDSENIQGENIDNILTIPNVMPIQYSSFPRRE